MTYKINKAALAAMLACAALTACSDDDDDDGMDVDGTEFAFSDAAFDDYTRVDRQGMPAVSTVLISSKDSYNAADPVDDAATDNPFVAEIITNLTTIHNALDDDLTGLELTPCTVVGDGTGTCVVTAAPLIIPDTISINTTADAGFPNGRLLTDPVIGVTLAVALLEVTGDPAPQTLTDLVGALNPDANDLEFSAEFPCLADPH